MSSGAPLPMAQGLRTRDLWRNQELSRARVSSKALRDKDGAVCLQDVRAGGMQVWASTA
jgi:hypothetical protein